MEIQKAPLRALEAPACPQHCLKLVVGMGAQLGPCQAQHHRHMQHGSHWL